MANHSARGQCASAAVGTAALADGIPGDYLLSGTKPSFGTLRFWKSALIT